MYRKKPLSSRMGLSFRLALPNYHKGINKSSYLINSGKASSILDKKKNLSHVSSQLKTVENQNQLQFCAAQKKSTSIFSSEFTKIEWLSQIFLLRHHLWHQRVVASTDSAALESRQVDRRIFLCSHWHRLGLKTNLK